MLRYALVCSPEHIAIASPRYSDLTYNPLSGDLSKPNGIAMLPIQEDIVMKILSKKALKELVLYSPQPIARLEKAGKFAKRVSLDPNRVGWMEKEVLDWLEERLLARE